MPDDSDLLFDITESVSCRIRVRRGAIDEMRELVRRENDVDDVVVLFDPTVGSVARRIADSVDAACVLEVRDGESGKTLQQVESLTTAMLSKGIGRRTLLVSVGGGVVTDLGGFLGGVYMRGVRCIHVPTTMLAMCDAALGGKCGVDLGGAKNMVGVIRQPHSIVVDPEVLETLPDSAFVDGVVEVVKKALMLNSEVYAELKQNMANLLRRDASVVDRCIGAAIAMKMQVVVNDEREAGRRMLLNFGHTVGHAIETLTDFAVSHGQAVALGMIEETRLLSPSWTAEVTAILTQMGMPTELDPNWGRPELWTLMQRDKKIAESRVRVAVPSAIGEGTVLELTKERFLNHGV